MSSIFGIIFRFCCFIFYESDKGYKDKGFRLD